MAGEWQRAERQRAKHTRWARRVFQKALMMQFVAFDSKWSQVSQLAQMTQNTNVPSSPVADAMNEVYLRVGYDFATLTDKELKSTMPYRTKDYTESAFNEYMSAWLATNAGARIDGITSYTQQLIQTILGRAVEQGLSIDKAQAMIREEFTAMSRMRAERIARTEIVGASNRGSLISAQSTGLTLNKEWIATLDPLRTRDTHMEADGQTVPLMGKFIVGGVEMDTPGDMSAPADEVVNCRCSIRFVRPK